MKERKKLLQKHELWTNGKVHVMNFSDKENVDIMDFWEQKDIFFQRRRLAQRSFLSVYETRMIL